MSQVMTITNGHVTVTIDSMGAQLTSLALDGREYLWQADPAWWGRHLLWKSLNRNHHD